MAFIRGSAGGGGGSFENMFFPNTVGYRNNSSFPAIVGVYYIVFEYYSGSDVPTVDGADILSYSSIINDGMLGTYGNCRFMILKATSTTIHVRSRWVDYSAIAFE